MVESEKQLYIIYHKMIFCIEGFTVSRNSYVLMLVYIDENRKDIAGNYYPENGFISNDNFKFNLDIMSGFYGIKWGMTDSLYYEDNNGKWVVVKTEENISVICLDEKRNRYKFKEGFVVCSGDLNSCRTYIIQNKNKQYNGFKEEALYINPEEIIQSV